MGRTAATVLVPLMILVTGLSAGCLQEETLEEPPLSFRQGPDGNLLMTYTK